MIFNLLLYFSSILFEVKKNVPTENKKPIKVIKDSKYDFYIIAHSQFIEVQCQLVGKKLIEIMSYISPKRSIGYNKIRLGNKRRIGRLKKERKGGSKGKKRERGVKGGGNGGYVILDYFKNIKIAYSIGIRNEVSFDTDLSKKNIDIFMYDHTINKLPVENPRFHWKKKGITGALNHNANYSTLVELLTENGHMNNKNMILKIDIEGDEWDVFLEYAQRYIRKI